MIAELERLTREEFGDEPASHLDWVELQVASGRTITELAAEIGKTVGLTIYRETLAKYLGTLQREVSEGTLDRARARGAHALAEGARQLAKDAGDTPGAVAKAKLRIDTDLWLASRWNRAELGEQKGANVQISLNVMHLNALRDRATTVAPLSPATLSPALPAPNEVEVIAEVIETQALPSATTS